MMVTRTGIVARYAETDQMGVIHHAVYPVWFEAARTEFVKQAVQLSYSQLEAMGVMTPLAELTCRYLSPARYEDGLTVETRVTALTPARIEFGYVVRRETDGAELCRGTTLHGWVDTKTFRPINMKKRHPELLSRMMKCMEE